MDQNSISIVRLVKTIFFKWFSSIFSNVETILSWTCPVYGPFEFRSSLGTSILPFLGPTIFMFPIWLERNTWVAFHGEEGMSHILLKVDCIQKTNTHFKGCSFLFQEKYWYLFILRVSITDPVYTCMLSINFLHPCIILSALYIHDINGILFCTMNRTAMV